MCTAISLRKSNHYFGRNLDLEYHYNEEVVIMPSNYNFPFQETMTKPLRYPMIGIATVIDDIPLYYDAANIHGLSMAGLNFPGNAVYHSAKTECDNVAPYAFIPWILRQCRTVEDAKKLLLSINITQKAFNDDLPITPLHWMISDFNCSIVVEPLSNGIKIYDNPIDVLTNNPPFHYHMYNLSNYLNLTSRSPQGDLWKKQNLQPFSNGMGSIGLPGDLSSASRFIKASYLLTNSECKDNELSCVNQFFHILDAVSHTRGSVLVNGKFEITFYTSCCNTTKGIYYYKTYNNSRVCAVDMHQEDLHSNKLIRYPLRTEPDIFREKH